MKVDIERLRQSLREVEEELGKESVLEDRERFKVCTREYSFLSSVLSACEQKADVEKRLVEDRELLKAESDPSFLEIVQAEIAELESQLPILTQRVEHLLVPPDPDDDRTAIVELRAGAGGQEAMLFVADCVRMYEMYSARMGWKIDPLSATPSDLGGFKEYIMAISGKTVYRHLRHEAGTHRVQRVPTTEAQGRIHTSTITVAVLLDVDDSASDIQLSESDIRFEATRSSGAGGQHVNKTDSAVRLTHIPTGIVVFCQEERSQHKNKDKAMRLLRAKVCELEERRRKSEEDSLRLEQVGTGDRSEKIRTYNYSQNRVTDHRINLTRYDLDHVMNGDLEDFSTALVAWSYKAKVAGPAYPWIVES